MKTDKMLLRLTHYDNDRRYLKKLPAYRLNEAENLATKVYLERVEIYKNQFGDKYMKEFQNDNTAMDMLHIAGIINRELKLRNKQSDKKPMKNKPTFEGLFRDKDNAKKVKEIFEIKGYTINGKWQGLTNKKGELLAAYYALKPILKPCQNTPTARIFYNEFGLDHNYITDDMLRKEPFNSSKDEFEIIFSPLLH